jgi:hypothetical protein
VSLLEMLALSPNLEIVFLRAAPVYGEPAKETEFPDVTIRMPSLRQLLIHDFQLGHSHSIVRALPRPKERLVICTSGLGSKTDLTNLWQLTLPQGHHAMTKMTPSNGRVDLETEAVSETGVHKGLSIRITASSTFGDPTDSWSNIHALILDNYRPAYGDVDIIPFLSSATILPDLQYVVWNERRLKAGARQRDADAARRAGRRQALEGWLYKNNAVASALPQLRFPGLQGDVDGFREELQMKGLVKSVGVAQ